MRASVLSNPSPFIKSIPIKITVPPKRTKNPVVAIPITAAPLEIVPAPTAAIVSVPATPPAVANVAPSPTSSAPAIKS